MTNCEHQNEIIYTESLRGVAVEQLHGFFVGWKNPPSPRRHLDILLGSDHVVLAIAKAPRKVVGFINAISDGVLSAYIPLLEVLPEFQKRGIGRELVTRMLGKLEHLYMVDLTCDLDMREFYEKAGLKAAFGMVQRNYERQNGGPR